MASAYVERIYRKYRGRRHPYYFLTLRDGKKRKRKYIPFLEVIAMMEFLEMEKRRKRQVKNTDKDVAESRDMSFFPKQMRFILKSAGYSIRGSTLKRGRNFMSKAAASVRFSMLEPECQNAVKSPENLLRLNREAYSLLKRRNRRGIKTSYQECMGELWAGV